MSDRYFLADPRNEEDGEWAVLVDSTQVINTENFTYDLYYSAGKAVFPVWALLQATGNKCWVGCIKEDCVFHLGVLLGTLQAISTCNETITAPSYMSIYSIGGMGYDDVAVDAWDALEFCEALIAAFHRYDFAFMKSTDELSNFAAEARKFIHPLSSSDRLRRVSDNDQLRRLFGEA